jgi:outer membrane protein
MRRLLFAFSALLSFLLVAAPVQAHEAGKWVIRGGIGTVAPDDKNLSLGDGVFVEVDDGTSLVLSGTYMFSQNLAFDILAAYPFNHDIKVAGDKAASTDHLPPTFSIQYHFVPDGSFQPYVGAGLNYTTFFSTDTTGPLDGTKLDLDDSFGFAWQVGADVLIGDQWLVNFDLRGINIETDAKLDGADLGTVKIDPLVYSVSLGYRF